MAEDCLLESVSDCFQLAEGKPIKHPMGDESWNQANLDTELENRLNSAGLHPENHQDYAAKESEKLSTPKKQLSAESAAAENRLNPLESEKLGSGSQLKPEPDQFTASGNRLNRTDSGHRPRILNVVSPRETGPPKRPLQKFG